MRQVVPVLSVVLMILGLWYLGAIWLNASWTLDQAARDAARRDALYADIEARLRRALSTRVMVQPQKRGARITIECYSSEEFEQVLDRILGEEDDE